MGQISRNYRKIFYHRDKSKAKKNTGYGGKACLIPQHIERMENDEAGEKTALGEPSSPRPRRAKPIRS